MDGEFDRELDDRGWGNGPEGPWKALSEQIKVMKVTVSKSISGKDREKEVTEAEERMQAVIRCAGYKVEQRRSLGELLW